MTILVTGGTGLVGSRLLRRFADAGVDRRALVRPGKEVSAGATPVEGDLLNLDSLKPAVEDVSVIVHLAAVFRTQNENDIWRASLDGTKNLIAAAKTHAPQVRLVMASTGQVYDADASHPGLEDATNPSLRIRQARSLRRTSSAIADSTGAFSVSCLSTAMGMGIWRRLLDKLACRERTALINAIRCEGIPEQRSAVRLATSSEANSWGSQTEFIAKPI
jgi:dTDP-4-dehydrorhamnose reductase